MQITLPTEFGDIDLEVSVFGTPYVPATFDSPADGGIEEIEVEVVDPIKFTFKDWSSLSDEEKADCSEQQLLETRLVKSPNDNEYTDQIIELVEEKDSDG